MRTTRRSRRIMVLALVAIILITTLEILTPLVDLPDVLSIGFILTSLSIGCVMALGKHRTLPTQPPRRMRRSEHLQGQWRKSGERDAEHIIWRTTYWRVTA